MLQYIYSGCGWVV